MNDNQKRFFDLAQECERLKQELKKVNEEMVLVMQSLGVNTYHQDSDLTVYKIVEPTGTFIEFKKIAYERTAKVGEKRGSLSKKEAEEQGFQLLGKE